MTEADDPLERETFKKAFIKNIRVHLSKIKEDYIRPDLGTTEFAFAYIPSEAVFWFLINEMYDELLKWTKDGVQVVSPLTISHKIVLIRSGVHALKLSEQASYVRDLINKLKKNFESIDSNWKTFFSSHLSNAWKKAKSVDESYRKIRDTFDGIQKFDHE